MINVQFIESRGPLYGAPPRLILHKRFIPYNNSRQPPPTLICNSQMILKAKIN